MPPAAADRNLLLGILALQMDFVNRDALVAGMSAWAVDKAKPLGQILAERGALAEAERAALEVLVDRHLARHDHDADKSLAALRPTPDACAHFSRVTGWELPAALAPTPEGHPTASVGPDNPFPEGGRYLRLRPHAKGGLGEVWVAADRELEREVALKEMQEQHAGQPDSRARFLLEARVTGGLEHPGIVPVYGLGHHPDGRPFYAMRFIRGHSLREAIEDFHQTDWKGKPSQQALAFRQLLGRFVDVCDAMEYAHSRGVLHRDLKPSNVMLGKYGETLVVDWGLARVGGREDVAASEGGLAVAPGINGLTQAGKALGTPAYMSPEQAAGRLDQLGPRADVYSLGATLYHLLTNQAPFPAAELADVLPRVERGDFPPPRQVRRGVPRALEAVCLKAMARDPQQRYASPRALAGDIEHWLADEPVGAYRESWTGRAGRWLKRYRTAVLGGVTVLVVAAAGLAVATALLSAKNEQLWQANVNEQAARLQEQAAREQAQKNFALAVRAVEDYLTGVANNDRLREKDLEPLRLDLLRSAQEFYGRFAERERDSAAYRSLVAQADIALGQIHNQLGEREQAQAHYAKAVATLQALAETAPGEFPHRERLVRATLEMADLLRLRKDLAAAETWARDGLRLSRQLLQDFPGERTARAHEAAAHFSLGEVAKERLRLPEAERELLAALRLQARLARDGGGWRETLTLVKGQAALGHLYGWKMKHPADAEKVCRQALEELDRMDAEAKKRPAVRSQLADCQRSLANALLLAAQPQAAEDLLRTAIRTQERLVADFPMIPSHREQLSSLFNDLSRCLMWRGHHPENLEVVREWVKVTERLTRDFPAVPFYRYDLANSHYALGWSVHKLNDKEESVRQRRQSVEVLTTLVKDHPDVPEYRKALSIYHNGLGFALGELKRWEESRAETAKALEVIRPLADKYPGVPDYQLHYAQALSNYSDALAKTDQAADALAHARETVAVLEKLIATTDDVEIRILLGTAYGNLAVRQNACGLPAEARAAVDRAIATLEEVLARDAGLADAQRLLLNTHRNRVKLLARLGREDAAVKDGQRALSLAHTGKYADSLREADALAAQGGLSAEGCYTLARVYALASTWKKSDAKDQEVYTAGAIGLLRRAQEAGYFQEKARVERLRREPNLAPLRDRPEFQKLAGGGK
jgi:serine/threonine-protein kinase